MQRIYSERVILPTGEQAAMLTLDNGKITEILPGKASPEELNHAHCEDFGSLVIMPGIIDPHVHVNEPGRTEWEGFRTATRAAAAGGVTTLVDMPLNSSPVTTTPEAFSKKRRAAENKCWIDVGFWGGIVPDNCQSDILEPMIQDGILGFKAFLIHSGIDDFPQSTADDLRKAMPILAKHKLPLLVHAELEGTAPVHEETQAQSYSAFLASRPNAWEDRAIEMMIDLCRETDCPTHIVHLSSATALPAIAKAKAEGLPFTVETCPHYLYFHAEQIPDGHPEYKCMPPIREKENAEGLWEGLKNGLIDFVVTDHSPCVPQLKHLESGDVLHAWGGIASLQFGLSSVWTRARKRGFSVSDLSRLMSKAPAAFIGQPQKGEIAVGNAADLVIWDPEAQFVVSAENIFFKHPVTPYQNQSLWGKVHKTFVSGRCIYQYGEHLQTPSGQFILDRSGLKD
jgi:allantoinase